MANLANIDGLAIASIANLDGNAISAGDVIDGLTVPGVATSIVVSAQEVEITVGAGQTSNTATLTTTIIPENAIVIQNCARSTSNVDDPDHIWFTPVITDGDTITVKRGAANAEYTVYCTVWEFTAASIQSVQHGEIAFAEVDNLLTDTDTLATTVDTDNAICISRGHWSTESGSSQIPATTCTVGLTDGDTATAIRSRTSADTNAAYTILEFVPGILDSVEQVDITINSSFDQGSPPFTNTATIGSIDESKTLLFMGGQRGKGSSSGAHYHQANAALTNGTTITATILAQSGGTTEGSISCTAAEFADGIIASVQRDVTAFAESDTTKNVTISAVVSAKSGVNWLGSAYNNNTNARIQPEYNFTTLKLTSTTNLALQRGLVGPSGTLLEPSWEIWEFV